MDSQNVASLAKNHLVAENRFILPEMLTKLIVSGCLQREEIEHAVKALGQLMVESDELISHILQPKSPEEAPDRFGLLSAFQLILSESTSLTRQAIFWVVSNLVLNSKADMCVFLQSGLISNVFLIAANSAIVAEKKEALWVIGGILNSIEDFEMLRILMRNYEIENLLIEILKREPSLKNQELQQIALLTLKRLFSINFTFKGESKSEG